MKDKMTTSDATATQGVPAASTAAQETAVFTPHTDISSLQKASPDVVEAVLRNSNVKIAIKG